MAHLREERPGDCGAVRDVLRAAFARQDEPALVDRPPSEGLAMPSLVAVEDGRVVGHSLFSRVRIETAGREVEAAALAPVAVLFECAWPGEALQVLELVPGALEGLSGMLRYPPPFHGFE